jgi:hypothetical protein
MAVPAEVPASPHVSRLPRTGRTDQGAGQQHWKRLSAGNVSRVEAEFFRQMVLAAAAVRTERERADLTQALDALQVRLDAHVAARPKWRWQ